MQLYSGFSFAQIQQNDYSTNNPMLSSSVQHLRCPKKKNKKTLCHGSFRIHAIQSIKLPHLKDIHEIRRGQLECTTCRTDYPILSGVALIVPDVRSYLLHHVKGIAQVVPDSEIPREFLREYLEAKSEIQSEHIEEDLEAERVTALYIMNHYLSSTTPESHTEGTWWTPKSESSPPFIDSLINLGVDSSFGSIAIARHLALGLPYSGQLKLPEDLIQGPVSRRLKLPTPPLCTGHADFIVGDLDDLPVEHGIWDLSVSLNTIDMLEEPFSLPKLQFDLIQPSGLAIQSCPYIWHPLIAKRLRKALPPQVRTSSSRAVEWMYEDIGFQIEEKSKDIPWLFFKHVRQLEIYSVHAFVARKP
ncbi:hypothetical protein EBS43_03620 [bacterium]|nr:hypothetical protein [bacterium]